MHQSRIPDDEDLHAYFSDLLPKLDEETRSLLSLYHRYRVLQERDPHEEERRLTFSSGFEAHLLDRISIEHQGNPAEWIGWIPLFRNHELGSFSVFSTGNETHARLFLKGFIQELLRVNPAAFYLFHRHPSEDLTPSPDDLRLTRTLEIMAKNLGIPLLGHGIIGIRRIRWIMLRYPTHENRSVLSVGPGHRNRNPFLRKVRKA